jgi:hypothetical protein
LTIQGPDREIPLMDYTPRPPSLAITVMGTAGFIFAALGSFVSAIFLLGLLLGGSAADMMLTEALLMSAIGFSLFRLARLIESGRGQLSAWVVLLLFGSVGLLGSLNATGLAGALSAALLAGAALSAGSLHECREWFLYAARTESAPRRRLVISFVNEPPVTPSVPARRSPTAKRRAPRASAPKPRATRSPRSGRAGV